MNDLSKEIIIIENPMHLDRLVSMTRLGQSVKPLIITLSESPRHELSCRGMTFKTLEDYGITNARLEEEALEWLRAFPEIKVQENKNIKEILTYDRVSVWWFVDEVFYWSKYVFHQVRETVKAVIMLDYITKIENPSKIIYVRDGTPISEAIQFVCKHKNIAPIAVSSSQFRGPLKRNLMTIIYEYGPSLQMLARKVSWMLFGQKSKSRAIAGKERILLVSGDNWVDIHDLKTGQIKKGDPYYDSIIDILQKNYELSFVGLVVGYFSLGKISEQACQQKIAYRPFEYYLNLRAIWRAFSASRELHRKYKVLTYNNDFRRSLDVNGLPIYELIKPSLSLFFSRGFIMGVLVIAEIAKHMVKTENPIAILMSDAPVPGRAIVSAAREKGIPTIATMHGGHMLPYDPNLNHIPADIGPHKESTTPYCPVVDKFVTYGVDDRDLLKRGLFPEEDVLVGGQPRYDILARADKLFNREEIVRKLGLDPSKKLITWMTQSHSYKLQENKKYVSAVYDAIKSLDDDVRLMVKMHPGENQKGKLYREDETLKPVIVGGFGAITFEVLYASDMVITHYCTTSIEALMLDKPLIIIDFSGVPISVPYVESGAAIGVYNEKALISTIKDILYNEETRQRLAKARERFVTEGRYKPDGLSSERVVNLIKQVIADSSRRNKKYEMD